MSLTPLMEAARDGDLQGVKANIGEARKQDEEGRTALMWAAFFGNLECAELLLSEVGMQATKNGRVILDRTTFYFLSGTTALMLAAVCGHSSIIPLLEMEMGMQDEYGWTALMYASDNDKLECANLLFSEIGMRTTKYSLISSNGTRFGFNSGTTALMVAADRGHTNLIPLLEKEIGMQDEDGWTALMLAASGGHANCIPLLEREVGKQKDEGLTALMLAACNGHTNCARLLLSEAGKQSTKVWYPSPPGTTALMLAAHQNYPEVVQLLLPYEQGMKDSKGHTAKWHANNSSKEGDFAQVRELLENEDSNRLPPPKEECLLMMSAAAGNVEGVRKHLDRAGYRDPTGTTALMLAAKNGRANCIPLLEREYRLQDNNGNTALMCAVRGGHKECIPLLEKEIGMQANDGRTALMLAAFCGYPASVRLLAPLERRMFNNRKETALLIALQEGHTECARLLAGEAAVREEDGQLHIERIQRLVREGRTDSILAKTYRTVENDIEAAVMRQLLKKLAPHHITPLLPPINRLIEGEDAQELGEAIWSALFGEPGALEELDDILCEVEDKMVDACAVCLSHPKDAVLLPCRHLVICEECADRIDYRCPYCRMKVDEALVLECPEGLGQ